MAEEIQKEEKEDKNGKNDDILSKCEKEKGEYLDGWKRAKADLINHKKDEAKRFAEMMKFSQEGLVTELLVVLDSFDLALSSSEKDSKTEKGLYLIKQQLQDILIKNGLKIIETKPGDDFDPAHHEAIAVVDSELNSGKVVEEVEKGYIINGRVIRPARVKVAK